MRLLQTGLIAVASAAVSMAAPVLSAEEVATRPPAATIEDFLGSWEAVDSDGATLSITLRSDGSLLLSPLAGRDFALERYTQASPVEIENAMTTVLEEVKRICLDGGCAVSVKPVRVLKTLWYADPDGASGPQLTTVELRYRSLKLDSASVSPTGEIERLAGELTFDGPDRLSVKLSPDVADVVFTRVGG